MSEGFTLQPVGRLERVDARSVWRHEAHAFTPWLLANGDRLADALGIELELTEREHPVGGFALDIIGLDVTNNCVLNVENQLEPADHSHLGQLLTYAAGTDASTIVWLAPQIRDEFRQALIWLNEHTDEATRFFGVEVHVVRIGDSDVAPLFELVAQPNDWQKTLKAASSGVTSQKGALYSAFWQLFIDRMRDEQPTWSKSTKPPKANWFATPGPFPGSLLVANFGARRQLRQELYIDRISPEACKALFDALMDQRNAIEQTFGAPLSWERLDGKKAARIAFYAEGAVDELERHGEFLDFFFDTGRRMRAALGAIDASKLPFA